MGNKVPGLNVIFKDEHEVQVNYWDSEIYPVLHPIVRDLCKEKDDNPALWIHKRLLTENGVLSTVPKRDYIIAVLQARSQLSDNGIRLQELANEVHSLTSQIEALKAEQKQLEMSLSKPTITPEDESLVKELNRKIQAATDLAQKVNQSVQISSALNQHRAGPEDELQSVLQRELTSRTGSKIAAPPSPVAGRRGSMAGSQLNPQVVIVSDQPSSSQVRKA